MFLGNENCFYIAICLLCYEFVKQYVLNKLINNFRYLSDGVTATCLCLNNKQDALIGTNCGRVFRYNIGGHKVWPSYFTYENTGNYKFTLKIILK